MTEDEKASEADQEAQDILECISLTYGLEYTRKLYYQEDLVAPLANIVFQ